MFVSDIAVFVLKRDVKLQPTNKWMWARKAWHWQWATLPHPSVNK